MNSKKKALALALSLAVILSMMPFGVFSYNTAYASSQADAVSSETDNGSGTDSGIIEETEVIDDNENDENAGGTDALEVSGGSADAEQSGEEAGSEASDAAEDSGASEVIEEENSLKEQTLQTKLGKKVIKVSGKFPEGASLQAVKVPVDTVEDITEGSAVYVVDISIISEGRKYQPEDFGEEVQISIENMEEIKEDSDAKILHIKSDVTDGKGRLNEEAADELAEEVRKGRVETEEIKTECSDGSVEFDASSFSVYAVIVKYTVDFYLFDEEFHIEGGTSVKLSELLEELAAVNEISDVKEVTFTSPELISVEQEGQDWVLKSLREFHTKELLTVTLKDDSIIKIGVMDKFSGAEGTCGTCTWTLDENYKLTIKPTSGNSGTLDELSAAADASWHDYRNKISSIVVENGVKTGENAAYIFSGCTNLTSVDVSGLDTSAATNLNYMFQGCSTLESIDLSGLDTSNVDRMNYLLSGCTNLVDANLSGFVTANTKTTTYMFNGCSVLKNLNVSGWNTEGITSMAYMFQNCAELANLNVSNWNTGNVTAMTYMFSGCAALTALDVSGWNTESLTTTAYMFNGCTVLSGIDISRWNTPKLTNMSYMFQNCKGITDIDMSDLDLAKVTTLLYIFNGCTKLESADLSDLTLSAATDIRYLFNGCSKLADVDISNFNAPKVAANCTYLFQNCTSLETIDLSTFNTPAATSYAYMFNGCTKLKDVTLGGSGATFNPVKVANMSYMFQNCSSLESIDLNNLNTSAVTNMAYMFSGCSSLNSIDIAGDSSKFKAAKVQNMSYMFNGCSSLTELDLTPLTLNAVTNTSYMFQNCSGLEKLQMTITKAGNNLNATYMLSNCSSLTDVDLQILQTGTNASVNYLFNGCSALEKIDLTKINSENITSMGTPLRNCLKIKEIKLGGTFQFKNNNTGLIDGYWDLAETAETESISTADLTDLSMSGQAEGTYVLIKSEYKVILYDDGELVFTKDGEPEEGRTVVDTYDIPSGATVPGWNSKAESITKVTFKDEIAPTTTYYWFYGCKNLSDENIFGLEKLDTKNVTYMTYMFANCPLIKNIDLSGFDTPNLISMAYMFSGCTGLESVKLTGEGSTFDTSKVTAMQGLFQKCSSLTAVDLTGFSTESATNISYMFDGCSKLTSLDLSSFDTNNVTTTAYMFQNCASLEEVQLSDTFTGPKVTTTAYMFNGCSALTGLDLSNFETSTSLTNMSYMFQNCAALPTVKVTGFVTTNVTNMSYLFSGCSALNNVDVTGFNTKRVTAMQYMFNNCTSLESIDLNGQNFKGDAATNMSYMFNGCSSLATVAADKFTAAKVTNASYMFGTCSSLTELDLSNFAAAATLTNVQNMFSGCKKLEKLNIAKMDTTKASTFGSVLNCANLKEITIGTKFKFSGSSTGLPYVYWDNKDTTDEIETIISTDLVTQGGFSGTYVYYGEVITAILYEDGELVLQGTETPDSDRRVVKTYVVPTGLNTPAWYSEREQIKKVTFKEDIKEAKPTGGYQWFYGCSNLAEVKGAENLNTSQMTSMYNMFNGCSSLPALDISEWDTANVTNMAGMFQDCSSLTELDVSSFITAKVTTMASMFNGCKALETLRLGDLNTSNVTTMASMFANCTSLPSLDVTGLDTQKVTTMANMFYECTSLTSLDVSNFNTSKVTTMAEMFHDCDVITEVKGLEKFDTSKVTTLYRTFEGCNKIKQWVGLDDWDVRNVTNMRETFAFCFDLESIDLSKWNTKSVTNLFGTFYECRNIKDINVSGWNTSKVTTMQYTFSYCTSLPTLDISNFSMNSVTSVVQMFAYSSSLESVVLPQNANASNLTNSNYMFMYCTSLKEADLSGITFSGKLTNAMSMFGRCEDLEYVDLSTLDVSNVQYFGDFFHDCTSLQTIILGEKFCYKQSSTVSGQLSNGFPGGMWLYDGDGNVYKATKIVEMLEAGSMPGTFTKVADHSMQADFPVQYKIGKIFKIDDFKINPKRGAADAVKEWNENWAQDGKIWMKVDGSELDPEDDTLRVPASLVLTFEDVVEDAYGNKFNLQMTYDNIILYDAKEIVMNSDGTGVQSTYYHHFFRTSKEGNICIRGEDRESLESESDPQISPNAVYDVTLKITDKNGVAQPGSFIFSIYDLDISSIIDYERRQAGDTETTTPSTERTERAYGLYSEGIYLKDGFDITTLTVADNTYLNLLGENDKWEGFRIQGTQIDSSSELTDVIIKGDASGSTFTWTGWSCEDFILYKYQPESIYFNKVDELGNRIDGAKIELYSITEGDSGSTETFIARWTTDSSKPNDYSALGLPPGKYKLKETEAPEDYELAPDLIFIIDTDYDVCDAEGNKVDGLYDENGNRIPEMNIVSMTDKSKPGKLKITKDLTDHENVQFGTRIDETSFIFSAKVTYKGKVYYDDIVTMVFNEAGSQTVTLGDFPAGATAVVEEIYAGGNYEVSGDGTVTVTIKPAPAEGEPDNTAEAKFVNSHDGGYKGGGSVENKYEKDGNGGWNVTQSYSRGN